MSVIGVVDAAVTDEVKAYLECFGHVIWHVDSPHLSSFETSHFDVFILPIDAEAQRGVDLCQRLLSECDARIIAVATEPSELLKIMALRFGADDSIDSGCSAHELLARIQAVTRRPTRAAGPDPSAAVMQNGSITVNRSTREAWASGKRVHLTRKEFDLLLVLLEYEQHITDRSTIIERVWGDTWARGSRTLDTHVHSLRNKFAGEFTIVTVRGIGYRLAINPSTEVSTDPTAGDEVGFAGIDSLTAITVQATL